MTINKVLLAGRLARDPEIKEIRSGLTACKLTIVTEYNFKKDGQDNKELCFTECTLWNKQAERCANSLKKGSMVTMEGRLKLEKWVDKETGKERSKLAVAAENIIFMEPKQLEIEKSAETWNDELPF